MASTGQRGCGGKSAGTGWELEGKKTPAAVVTRIILTFMLGVFGSAPTLVFSIWMRCRNAMNPWWCCNLMLSACSRQSSMFASVFITSGKTEDHLSCCMFLNVTCRGNSIYSPTSLTRMLGKLLCSLRLQISNSINCTEPQHGANLHVSKRITGTFSLFNLFFSV